MKTKVIRKVQKEEGPHRQIERHCIGCQKEINPSFCYIGTMIKGLAHGSRVVDRMTPITAIISVPCLETVHIIGGENEQSIKRFSYFTKVKGPLCDDCAGNYHTITDSRGEVHQVVQTLAAPGTILRGALKQKGRVIRDGDKFQHLPAIEVNMDPIYEDKPKSSGPVSGKSSGNSVDNHWLDVGRRK